MAKNKKQRLTTDNPQGNFDNMMNFVYDKDGKAYIRNDGKKDHVLLSDYIDRLCAEQDCPIEDETDARCCDCTMDSGGTLCPVSIMYIFASEAVQCRGFLKRYEDTGLTSEEIAGLKQQLADEQENTERLSEENEILSNNCDNRCARDMRLFDWARETLTGDIANQFWYIAANGYLMTENPEYQQRINVLKQKLKQAEADNAALLTEVKNYFVEVDRRYHGLQDSPALKEAYTRLSSLLKKEHPGL